MTVNVWAENALWDPAPRRRSVILSLTVLRGFVHCLFPLCSCQTHSHQSVLPPPQTAGVGSSPECILLSA